MSHSDETSRFRNESERVGCQHEARPYNSIRGWIRKMSDPNWRVPGHRARWAGVWAAIGPGPRHSEALRALGFCACFRLLREPPASDGGGGEGTVGWCRHRPQAGTLTGWVRAAAFSSPTRELRKPCSALINLYCLVYCRLNFPMLTPPNLFIKGS